MEDLFQYYEDIMNGDKDKWAQEWLEESQRRQLEDEDVCDVIPKRYKYLILSKRKLLEKEFGPRWVCRQCKAEYRVKTSFYRLFCSECLGPLRCRRLFAKDHNKSGYWIFEDDRNSPRY